jgi:hypothetical protein
MTTMGLLKEFRDFAMRGNVIDLAVGVVIGSAFGKIISSLVANIIMPPLNLLTSKFGVNFTDLAYKIKTEAPKLNPDGTMVMDDGKPVMVQRDGKSVEAKTPALLMCGKQPEAFTLELEGFSPAQVTVQAMQRASTEAPLPVIPAHRVHFTERVQTEVAAAGGWVIAGLRNGKLGIASARTGQVLRIVDLGGLRAVEGSPFAIGDRAWCRASDRPVRCGGRRDAGGARRTQSSR